MNTSEKQSLREFLKETLESRGDRKEFDDEESLFISGRLDSFSMMNLVMYLEQAFDLDFAELEFDVNLVDSVKDIQALVDSRSTV